MRSSPLVIRPGWRAAYDKWDRQREEREQEEWENFEMDFGEDNMLMLNGKPIIYDKGEHAASITTRTATKFL